MSRVYRDKDKAKYEQECEERARLARLGKLDTHAIQQSGGNLVKEWEPPYEGWEPASRS